MTLQLRAENIITELNLLNILAPFGEVHLVGNVAFGTTVKPDIDIQIYSKQDSWKEISDQIVAIFGPINPTRIVQRYLKQSGKHLTSFIYEDGNNTKWTLDITQTNPSEDYLKDAYKFYLDFKDKITAQKADKIIELKQYFLEKDKLKNSMAYYIYRAVIDSDAKKPEDVYKYVGKMNSEERENQ